MKPDENIERTMKMRLKKIFVAMLPVAVALYLFGCASSHSNMLKIYTWHDYIDTTLFPEFEKYYAQQTGNRISVTLESYRSNEELQSALNRGKSYDLICPSDYMVEQLIAHHMLRPIDHSRIAPLSVYTPWLSGFGFDRRNAYSVPYTFGTTGLMYNSGHKDVDDGDMQSWAALWNPKYANRIVLQNSIHELYYMAVLYNKREALSREIDMQNRGSFSDVLANKIDMNSAATREQACQALIAQHSLGVRYRKPADGNLAFAKDVDISVQWSSDAVNYMRHNKALKYAVPKEGSMLYIDSWAIPVSAKHVDAAHEFLKFISSPENARRNMQVCGTPSAIHAAAQAYQRELESDENLFMGTSYEWKKMFIDAFITPPDVMNRCAYIRMDSTVVAMEEFWHALRR
jgi:spermidine/putrescine transport system substrate-binding protein